MRFLHLADVHLDTPFAGRTPALRGRLRDACRQALRRAVDLAVQEELHAVLVAGDLFDGERLSFETETFLVRQFRRLAEAGVALVYATGNHDPGHGGLRGLARPWPENVTVVADRSPRRIAVRDPGGEQVGWVTAAGHASPRETTDLSRLFPRPAGDLPEVGLLHTQVHGALDAEDHHPYAPSELGRLVRAGFHYWALGHVHTRQRLAGDPPIHYPGSLQGRTPAETGARGALLVDLEDPSAPRVSFRPLAPVRWETLPVGGLGDVGTVEGLVGRVREAWNQARVADPDPGCDGWIVRVELGGPSLLWRELGREEDRRHLADEIAREIGALEVEVRIGGVRPPVDVRAHRGRTDVLGEALDLLEEVRSGGTTLDGAGPGDLAAAASDRDLDVARYVRELLDGTESELLARLLAPDSLDAAIAAWAASPDPEPPDGAAADHTERDDHADHADRDDGEDRAAGEAAPDAGRDEDDGGGQGTLPLDGALGGTPERAG